MFFSRPLYGLYITDSAAYLVQGVVKGSSVQLKHKAKVALTKAKRGEALKKLLPKKNTQVVLVLPPEKQYFALVTAGKKPQSVQQVLPEALTDLVYVENSLATSKGSESVVTAVNKTYLQEVVAEVVAAGFVVVGASSATPALQATASFKNGIVVHADGVGSTVVAVHIGGSVIDEQVLKTKATTAQITKAIQSLWEEYKDRSLQGVSICMEKSDAGKIQKDLKDIAVQMIAVPKADLEYSRAALGSSLPKARWLTIPTKNNAI